jgi:hypothetical protein
MIFVDGKAAASRFKSLKRTNEKKIPTGSEGTEYKKPIVSLSFLEKSSQPRPG